MTADDQKAAVLKYVRKQKHAALRESDATLMEEDSNRLIDRAIAYGDVEHFLKTFNTSAKVE